MLSKQIKISAKLDTGDFDRAVSGMQKKLREIYSGMEGGRSDVALQQRLSRSGFGPPPTEGQKRQAEAQERQSLRELDRYIKDQAKSHESINKALSNRQNQLKELNKQIQEMTKAGEKDVALLEKKKQIEESINRLRTVSGSKASAINEALFIREGSRPEGMDRVMRGFERGGVGGASRAFGRELLQNPSFMATVVGAIGAAVGTVAQGANIMNNIGLSTDVGFMSARQQMVNQPLQNIFSGRGFVENAFMRDRAMGIQRAMGMEGRQRMIDAGMGVGGLLAGAGAGAATGAKFGSVLGLPGMLVGGVTGAIGGVAASGGLNNILGNIAGIPYFREAYEAESAQRLAGNIQQAQQVEMQRDPLKRMALETYAAQMDSNLQFQRAMGLNNAGFNRGGGSFLNQGFAQGFTREQMMGSAMGIMQAGGGTRAARGLAGLSNQLQRGLDLTNADAIIGAIGGTMGGAAATQNATIKVLAEGVRLGLDGSEFVEENRRFTQAAANIISQSGTQSAEGAGRLAARFGDFVADRSVKGIEAAQGAFSIFNQLSGRGGGVAREAIERGLDLQDPNMRKLAQSDPLLYNQIASMDVTQMTPDNPIIQSAARKAGMTAEDFINTRMERKQQRMTVTPFADRGRASMKKLMEGGKSFEEVIATPEGQDAFAQIASGLGLEGVLPGNQAQQRALVKGFVTGGAAGEAEMKKVMEEVSAPTGRVEDRSKAAQAQEQNIVNESIQKYRGAIDEAATSTQKLSLAMAEALERLNAALNSKDPRQIQEAVTGYMKTQQTQPKAGPGR